MFPILDPEFRRFVTEELFAMELQDNEHARELHSSGAYLPVARKPDVPAFSAQAYFIAAAGQRDACVDMIRALSPRLRPVRAGATSG